MKKINFGIIGCGRISNRHLDALVTYKDRANIIAASDIDPKNLKTIAQKYKIKNTYTDYRQLVKQPEVDAVIIATPNGYHKQQAVAAAKAGKHAIIEKPLGLDTKEVDQIIAAFKKANRQLFAVLQVRHNPPVKFLKEFISENHLGKIRYATMNVRWYRPPEYFKNSWRGTKKLDGGTLLNQGIHYVDILQWLIGMPQKLYGKSLRLFHTTEVEDTAFSIWKISDKTWANFEFTVCNYPKNSESSINVIAEKGNLQIGGDALDKITHWNIPSLPKPRIKESIKPNVYAGGMYQGSCPYHFMVYLDALNTLQKNTPNKNSGEEARKSIQIVESIYKSSSTNKEVLL